MPITFQTSTIAVAQIFAMGALGFYLVRRGFIPESGLKLLSFLSVNVIFPLFIFNQIVTHFDPARMPFWWCFPLINIALVLGGVSFTGLLLARGHSLLKHEFMAVSSMHNAGYIPVLILMSLPLGALAGQIYACVIMSVIGFDTCLWSLGVWLLTRSKSSRMDLGKMINPPLLSMASAIILVLAFGPGFMPEAMLKPVKVLGDAAMGMAMLVIGGNLSLTRLDRIDWFSVSGVAMIKLMVLPLVTLGVFSVFKLNPLISLVAIIQACMPSSITLSIIGRNYGTKNQDFVNQSILVTHILCVFTIPVFLGLFGKLFN